MNGIGAKIILSFFGLVFFVVLVFFSFSSQIHTIRTLPDFGKDLTGEYKYIKTSSGTYSKYKVTSKKNTHSGSIEIFEKNIDIFSNIYSTELSYKIIVKDNTIDISLSEGSYLFDFRNPFKKISIHGTTYEIVLKSGGMVYIENIGEDVFISSFNTIAELNFISQNTKEKTIGAYLYPHMYLAYNSKRVLGKEGLDSLRLSQLARLGYFSEGFDTMNLSELGVIKDNGDFLSSALEFSRIKQNLQEHLLNKNKDLSVWMVPGIGYIEQYFLLFYNKKKKVVYYQNKVLRSSINLISSVAKDVQLVDSIYRDLIEIKQLDSGAYTEMVQLVEKFSQLSFNSLSKNADTLKENHLILMEKVFGFPQVKSTSFIKDFDKLNYLGNKTFYRKLLHRYSNNANEEGGEYRYEYYLFFIKNILLEGFKDDSLDQKYFKILIDLFQKYSDSINNLTKFQQQITDTESIAFSKARVRVITNIVYNEELLKVIKKALLGRYFGERNDQGLLEKNKEVLINVLALESGIKNLELFYTKGKKYLLSSFSKYRNVLSSYAGLHSDFKEYFLALTNYALYQKKYSHLGIEIDNIKVFAGDDDSALNEERFRNYIGSFNGVDLNSMEMTVTNLGYDVETISISGRIFSFFVNPHRGNRIMDIKLKNSDFEYGSKKYIFYYKLENITYELDNEKIKYETLYKKAKPEDKEKLNFKNFFLNNFFPSDIVSKDICDDESCNGDGDRIEDDEVVQLFKSAKLLGNQGEFRNIKGILDLKYRQITVQKTENKHFKIIITNTTLGVNVEGDRRKEKIFSDFSSNYRLEGSNHYFYEIVLKPYQKDNKGKLRYIFDNAILKVYGNVYLGRFDEQMKQIMEAVLGISKKYKTEIENKGADISQINYYLSSGEVTFE